MEKVNAYTFYEMARELRQLHALADDVALSGAFGPIVGAQRRMENLLKKGDPVPLGVSKQAGIALANAVEDLWQAFFVDDGQGGMKFEWPANGKKVQSWHMSSYRTALQTFETVFSAEMTEAATYFIPRKGIFFTPALVDGADESFPAELRPHIPNKSIDDWRAAGRCLAFNLLSASGFHVARAVEGILEVYYQRMTGKTGTENGWYDYIKALESVTGPQCPSSKTLAALRQMKDDYRNPLMHPRVVLDESEARILFANGESLIMGMASEIKSLGATPMLPGLINSASPLLAEKSTP